MRLKRGHLSTGAGIPTSSMADIAFLLLIFFLVTTIFDEEKGLQLVLPEAKAEEVAVSSKNILHIMVDQDGVVFVRRGKDPNQLQIEVSELEDMMRQAIAENPNIIAAVKTAPNASYKDMIDVLDELNLAEARKISLQEWNK